MTSSIWKRMCNYSTCSGECAWGEAPMWVPPLRRPRWTRKGGLRINQLYIYIIFTLRDSCARQLTHHRNRLLCHMPRPLSVKSRLKIGGDPVGPQLIAGRIATDISRNFTSQRHRSRCWREKIWSISIEIWLEFRRDPARLVYMMFVLANPWARTMPITFSSCAQPRHRRPESDDQNHTEFYPRSDQILRIKEE